MEVLCRFKGWMQSQIKEISITCVILDQNPTPVQRLSAFNNQWSIQYISHFERNLYAGAMFEWIQNPRSGEYIALFWWSLTPAQKLNAIKIQRNSKYILHFGWKSYAGSKTECNHKSRNYQLHVWFSIKILAGSKVKWIRYQRNAKYISHCSWRSRKDFQNTVGAVQKTWFVTVFVFVLRAACTRREWSQ
jgi:hypothetical protein